MIKKHNNWNHHQGKPKLLISSNIGKSLFSDTVPTSLQDTLTRENLTLSILSINQIKIITHNYVIMETILDKYYTNDILNVLLRLSSPATPEGRKYAGRNFTHTETTGQFIC